MTDEGGSKPNIQATGGPPYLSRSLAMLRGDSLVTLGDREKDPADCIPLPAEDRPREIGGPKGKEPTRYGDWERKGRCIDF